jgi:acyl carrier protein
VDDLTRLIEESAREIAEERGADLPGDFGSETKLFGSHGVFDSMGLVTLIVAVEESISEKFGVEVTLADERAMSQKRSPFLTISSLSAYARELIDEGR